MADSDWVDILGDGGVLKKVLKVGTGVKPTQGDDVNVHYTGTLTEGGQKFDSSRDRGKKFSFPLGAGRVIKAWDMGVATMVSGERCILRCRADYAYGDQGSPPTIPGGASLDFDVELFDNFDSVADLSGVEYIKLEGPSWGTKGKEEGTVTFDFKVTCERGENVFFEQSDVTLQIGYSEHFPIMPQWVHICLKQVPQDQICLFRVTQAQQFTPEEWGTGNDYFFTVNMKSVQNPKELWQMSEDEKIAEAQSRKERGNEFFRNQNFERALYHYNKAYEAVKLPWEDKSKDDPNADMKTMGDEFLTLFVAINSNLAMAALKLQDNVLARDATTRSLEQAGTHVKSLARRAQAYIGLGDYNLARTDCGLAISLAPGNKYVKQLDTFAKKKLAQIKKKEKAMAARMFSS